MPIQTACPNCAKGYNVADAMKGKNVKCKNCAKVFLVDAGAAKTPVPAAKSAKPAATAPTPTKTAPKKTSPKPPVDDDIADVLPADDDYDDPDDRPARKAARKSDDQDQPKKKSGGMMWLLLAGGGAFGFLLLIGCVGGLWYFMGGGVGGKTIDEASFDKLKKGMTEQEVKAVLGKPTRNLDLKSPFGIGGNPVAPNAPDVKTSVWEQKTNSINVTFENGKATMFFGSFKTATGSIQRFGLKNDQVAEASSPPPVPNNPPPQNPKPEKPQPPNAPTGSPAPPTNPPVQPVPPEPPNNAGYKKGSKVTQETFNKITLGMKGKEVGDLLGNAFNYPQLAKANAPFKTPSGLKSTYMEEWRNGKGRLKVWYNEGIGGVVIDKEMTDLPEK